MAKFKVEVLYETNSSYARIETIECDYVSILDAGCYEFCTKGHKAIAWYPMALTIVTRIEEKDESEITSENTSTES